MKFSGLTPYKRKPTTDHPSPWYSWNIAPVYWFEDESGGRWRYASYADTNRIFGSVVDRVVNSQVSDYGYALSNMNKIDSYSTFYPIITSIDDYTPVTVQPPILYEFPTLKSNNQPAYSKSVSNKSVIVSPYQKGHFKVTFRPGHTVTWQGQTIDYAISLGKFVPGIPVSGSFEFGGRKWRSAPVIIFTRRDRRVTEVTKYTSFDPDTFAARFLEALTIQQDVVTECVVSANGGTVDLATSLAELPQAAHGILQGATAIVKLYKDARKGELRIRDSVKSVRAKWDREISRLENLSNRDDAAIATAKKQQQKDINNLLHAIASVWLTYRLNIYPMSKTIESTIDGLVLGYASSEFVRFREQTQFDVPTEFGGLTCTFRTFIKRSIIAGAGWQNFFSVNLARTAWELVPLSFVLDRYIAVGDWITANLSSPESFTLSEGATNSWIVKTALTHPDLTIEIDFMRREVYSPDDYCPLMFPPERSLNQKLDHLALAWKLLTKKV